MSARSGVAACAIAENTTSANKHAPRVDRLDRAEKLLRGRGERFGLLSMIQKMFAGILHCCREHLREHRRFDVSTADDRNRCLRVRQLVGVEESGGSGDGAAWLGD